jgi:deoxyhypusine synthase
MTEKPQVVMTVNLDSSELMAVLEDFQAQIARAVQDGIKAVDQRQRPDRSLLALATTAAMASAGCSKFSRRRFLGLGRR